MNQHGLCVTFASCGLPVGNKSGMLQPEVDGLNFMVIVRLLLETCQTTKEAVERIGSLPIASNMNLLITDRSEETVVVETINGEKHIQQSLESCTIVTNHALLDSVKEKQKRYMNHSMIRYNVLKKACNKAVTVSQSVIKALMSTGYPEGLSVQNYQECFGTVYTALLNIEDRIIEFSFGSPKFNEIHCVRVGGK